MAYSAPLYMEVRWRLHGSDEAWSEPRRVNPVREVVVEELDRTKQYDFEARNVSACGAKSDWVPSTHTVPDVPPGNLTLADIKTEADNAAADALAANQELANIASDNVLSQGEKPVVIRDTNVITTEQAGIDAQATAFGVTTEKTAYDNAVTALTTYLATLTTPVLWSNLSGDTTIVGTTFRSKFADVYTTRQALLNAIYAAAKARADAAQDAADQAGVSTSVRNANFTGSTAGWSFTASPGPVAGGEFYQEATTNSPYPPIATYLVHAGQAGQSSAYADNLAYLPVAPGQVVTGVVCLQAFSANAGAYAAAVLKWYDASGTFLSITSGQPTCGPGGSYLQCNSKAQAPAPNNAAFVRLSILYVNHTSGYINATACRVSGQLTNLDDLPDGSSYVRGAGLIGTAVAIPNSTFQMALDANGKVPGWTNPSGYGGFSISTASHQLGKQALLLSAPASGLGVLQCDTKFKVVPGDDVYVGGWVYPVSGSFAAVAVAFYDANDSFLSPILQVGASSGSWAYYTGHAKAPANAAYFILQLRLSGPGSGTSFAYFNEIDAKVNDLRVAGSGAKVGNQFNNPNSLTLNYGAVRSTTALTGTSAGAVSVSAFDYYAGSASVHYNAVSNAVTGLSQGSTYFIYCRDAVPTGGTKTWLATTNVNALLQTYDDIVVAGQVTIPTSGSSGGGGGGLCVCDGMLVAEDRRAGDAEEGDLFDCMDLPRRGLEKFQRALQSVERSAVECVRLTTEHGAIWDGSASTPFDLIEGGVEWAPRMKGRQVVTDFGIEAVVRVEHIGVRPVSHLHFGGCSYAAGRDARHRVYSHNLQWKP